MLNHIVLTAAATVSAGTFNAGGAPPTPASSCVLSGTVTSIDQDDGVAGGYTFNLKLNADGWAATVGDDNAITTAIRDGILSAQSEAAGFNAVIKPLITHAIFTRVSDTELTIGPVPAAAGYATTASEVLTVWNDVMGQTTGDGLWHCYEYEFQMDTDQTDGVGRLWIDGTLRIDRDDCDWSNGDTDVRLGWEYFHMLGNQAYVSDGPYTIDVDDMVIYSTSTPANTDAGGNPYIGTV